MPRLALPCFPNIGLAGGAIPNHPVAKRRLSLTHQRANFRVWVTSSRSGVLFGGLFGYFLSLSGVFLLSEQKTKPARRLFREAGLPPGHGSSRVPPRLARRRGPFRVRPHPGIFRRPRGPPGVLPATHFRSRGAAKADAVFRAQGLVDPWVRGIVSGRPIFFFKQLAKLVGPLRINRYKGASFRRRAWS